MPSCCYCLDSLPSVGYRICKDCPREYTSCEQCWSLKAESGDHTPQHEGRVVGAEPAPLFGPPFAHWSAEELTNLLAAVEQWGLGNWEAAAEAAAHPSTECEYLFSSIFVDGNLAAASRPHDSTRPSATDLSHESSPPHPGALAPALAKDLAYYPLRDEYELEHDQLAEVTLASAITRADDPPEALAYQRWQTARYCDRLRRRKRIKSVARQHQLWTAVSVPRAPLGHFSALLSPSAISRLHADLAAEKDLARLVTASGAARRDPLEEEPAPEADELLCPAERTLVTSLNLSASRYLGIKAAVLRDYVLRKTGRAAKLRYPPGLEPAHRRAIISFLNENNWTTE